MTPYELDAIRERAALLDLLPGLAGIQRDVGDLLAYVDALECANKLGQAVHAHAMATITELSHHGDMTPTAKRVLMNVLDGAEPVEMTAKGAAAADMVQQGMSLRVLHEAETGCSDSEPCASCRALDGAE